MNGSSVKGVAFNQVFEKKKTKWPSNHKSANPGNPSGDSLLAAQFVNLFCLLVASRTGTSLLTPVLVRA